VKSASAVALHKSRQQDFYFDSDETKQQVSRHKWRPIHGNSDSTSCEPPVSRHDDKSTDSFVATATSGRFLVSFPSRPGTRLGGGETSEVPRKELLHVQKVSDCARLSHASQYAVGRCCLLVFELDRRLGIRPVSQLNTRPVASPVNASRRPSRDAAHHSGSGWLARPSPWWTCTSYSLPASPGALNSRVIGLNRRSVRVMAVTEWAIPRPVSNVKTTVFDQPA
jgi:hypothetical protein